MALKIAFFGTPAFAVPTLERLLSSRHAVAAVVTQPDRPRGRGQRVTESPVKLTAAAHSVPVLQPARAREPGLAEALAAEQIDLGVVAAYGQILPESLLAVPRLGMINVHASLLPRWRGAAPIHRAVLAGDAETGVTIMRVVRQLDAGPMLLARATPIGPDETSAALEQRLATIGADLLLEAVDRLSGRLSGQPGMSPLQEVAQDDRLSTYAARLERRESQVDWSRPAREVHNQIRGLQPWPLAAVFFQNRRLLLLGSHVATEEPSDAVAGTIVAVERDALVVAASPGAVRIVRVQIEGRAPVTVRDFLNGRQVVVGERFEPVPLTA